MIRVDLQLDSDSCDHVARLCEGLLSEEFGPGDIPPSHPVSNLIYISRCESWVSFPPVEKTWKPTTHRDFSTLREGHHLNLLTWCVVVPIMEPLNTTDVLQWAPSLPVKKGPHLNPSRWHVVFLITEPFNTSDVLRGGEGI